MVNTTNKPASTQGTGKRGGKTKTSWKPGQSGNPAGREKDSLSWAAIVKDVSNMDVDDILTFIGTDNELGKAVNKMPRGVQLKYLVIVKVFATLMVEPTSGLWNGLMDRAEGKVPDHVRVEHSLEVEGLEVALDKVYGKRPALLNSLEPTNY